jgi:hypothetical protein
MPRSAQRAASVANDGSRGEERAQGPDEWLFYYDWFAGWRWERHRGGALVAESLYSFETKDDCMRDADEQRRLRAVRSRRRGV